MPERRAKVTPGQVPEADVGHLHVSVSPPALAVSKASEGQWFNQPWRITFTFAGWFLGAVNFRCLTLVRSLEQPPYPLTPSLFHLLPPGVRCLYISTQPTTRRLPRIFRLGTGICYVPNQGRRYFIDLKGSFAVYLGKFKKKPRYNLRRTIRRFTEVSDGSVNWRQFSAASEMTEFHRLAIEVSQKTYQHTMLREGIDASLRFREEIIRAALEDRVRGYILFHRGMPIAYMFCRARVTDLVIEKIGFDPSLAAYAPGTVLHYVVLSRLFSGDRFRRLDFGPGEYCYKARLATGSIEAAEIYCFPCSFRNGTLIALHSAVSGAGYLLRSILELLGVGQRLKTMVRRGIHKARRE